ncbi:MAG: BolA family protein [Myxococcota bacterium]
MPLQILSSPSAPEEVAEKLRRAIAEAIPGAAAEVDATGARHFEIRVTSEVFAGKSRVAQQRLVYAAIAHLMKGDEALVHAVDQLETRVP